MFNAVKLGYEKISIRFLKFFLFFALTSFTNNFVSTPEQSEISKNYEKYYEEIKRQELSQLEFEYLIKKSDEYLDYEHSKKVTSSEIAYSVQVKIIFFLSWFVFFTYLSKRYKYQKIDFLVSIGAIFLGGIIFLSLLEIALYIIFTGGSMLVFCRKRN
ncbi:hypothetical protein OFY17_07700 [Marinomonas sp. C2222]|uniref:DUF4064 domain-containing protein n=1 Tax=Marinomonas sargassi TaxID=2984494 RepID=A0ABT2YSB5_9GAMM|nr:hypothetical protein [Marinomonas sargassi]MCV2402766.1 hypothetical protein [Marinomonas sargassi]